MESVSLMEPMYPKEGNKKLEDLAFDLISKSSSLASQTPEAVKASIGDLVRSMNCYYSNLIEGHNTHPRDIDRALVNDYSSNIEKRNLQLEARAHIEVQSLIDYSQEKQSPFNLNYANWLHYEFCSRLPDELLWVKSPDGKTRVAVKPGEYREGDVQVGQHIPPSAKNLARFMNRFTEVYDFAKLSKIQAVIAIPAAHHRLLWIHPFYDGNGRVARLISHSWFKALGIGNSLWSISRGLGRNANKYKSLLMAADEPRRGDLDGRGNLTEAGMSEFCEFFLATCIDQINFMNSILEPTKILERIERYTEYEIEKGELPKGSFSLLRHAVLSGEFERGKAAQITNYKERQARTILTKLLNKGLLKSDTPKSSVRLGIPSDIVESWFPKLYPPEV